MTILVLDLHAMEKNVPETEKILRAIQEYDKPHMIRLFSDQFTYENIKPYHGIVLSGFDRFRILTAPKGLELRDYLKRLEKEGKYILGICGGHHFLGVNYGCEYKKVKPQFGWPVIRLTNLGKTCDLFRGLDDFFTAFEFHYNGFTDVGDSEILARDENCVQAVKYSRRVFGIQFHPEESPKTGLDYLKFAYEKSDGAERAAMIEGGIHQAMSPEYVPQSYEEKIIFKNFVDMTSEV